MTHTMDNVAFMNATERMLIFFLKLSDNLFRKDYNFAAFSTTSSMFPTR